MNEAKRAGKNGLWFWLKNTQKWKNQDKNPVWVWTWIVWCGWIRTRLRVNGENEFCFRVCRETATVPAAHRGARETGRNGMGGDLFMASLYSSSLRRSCCGGSRFTFHVSSRFFQLFELLFWWRIALGCAGLISYSYNPPSASWRGSRRVSEIHAPTKDPERDANKDAKNKPRLIRFLRNSLVI
jgi:hypothetical protein